MYLVAFAILTSLASIGYGLFLTAKVLKNPRGSDKMNEISDAIEEGAVAYMKRQYKVVGIIGLIIFAGLYFIFNQITALAFLIGAVFSAISGIVGMMLCQSA